ncbi:peptidyl-prolyl cis-trans isomerase, EpsD family [Porphyrobacter algicida]|uniref:Peptidyl-prolyl cis-trans isomerase, EpsD family n=1 Tax=Qipengyuania algicida TaxID=1836209 RepID=A0A845AG84_9SPHN|nr:peptidyl-prolyl cis-trans isomerase, EpsD family [Qipengyuania algicida]
MAALAALTGCDSKPEGQVVAVVNGQEITTQEVNGELQNAPKLEGDEGKKIQNMALDRVVDRQLLADVAKKDGIESSPEYVLRKKKMDEGLLVQMLGEKLARDLKQPSAQDIQNVINSNPQAFADRTVFLVDQIVFPTPDRKDVMTALQPAKNMDDVVATLNRFGIKFQRGNNQINSAQLPPQMFSQMKQVGTSEPLIVPTGPTVAVVMIKATKPAPVTGDNAKAIANQMFVKQTVAKEMKERLDQAKKDAKIEYQSGFGAPETPSSDVPGVTAKKSGIAGLPTKAATK